jgi:hypothetical protein
MSRKRPTTQVLTHRKQIKIHLGQRIEAAPTNLVLPIVARSNIISNSKRMKKHLYVNMAHSPEIQGHAQNRPFSDRGGALSDRSNALSLELKENVFKRGTGAREVRPQARKWEPAQVE